MGGPILAFWGLTILALVAGFRVPDREVLPPIQRRETPPNVLTFQGTFVQSLPYDPEFEVGDGEFGTQRLPLRSAVEAQPDIPELRIQRLRDPLQKHPELAYNRIPLRDFVERRTAPFFGGFNHESIWLTQVKPSNIRRNKVPLHVLCHFDSTGVYRDEPFSLTPNAIPSRKCTHLIYKSATFDPKTLKLVSYNPEYDEKQEGYKLALQQRERDPSLRVFLSIVLPDVKNAFDAVSRFRTSRGQFVYQLYQFLEEYDFDGVVIDWDVDWNRDNLLKLRNVLNELGPALSLRGRALVVSLRPSDVIDPEIANLVDLVILKAWRDADHGFAVHRAPLSFAMAVTKRWTDAMVDPRKIILGIPLFGSSYTLKFKNSTTLGSPVIGPGIDGTYTRVRGSPAYFEICEKLEDLWEHGRDEDGPYVKRGDQWIGYEDPVSVKLKAAFVRSAGLGGVSLTNLDLDDFVGICGEPWPMLDTAVAMLGNYYKNPIRKCELDGLYADPDSCAGYHSCEGGMLYRGMCTEGRFFDKSTKRCVDANANICTPSINELKENGKLVQSRYDHEGPRVACYVTSWSMYRKGEGKFVPERLNESMCTDVIYSFAGLNPETLEIQPFDPWADIDNELYDRITSVTGPRILLGLGGWTDSAGSKYSRLVSNPKARTKFVKYTVDFLRMYQFDGMSLEWLYPVCWQSQCNRGLKSDRPNFTKLVKELREAFDAASPKLTLAVAVSGYKEIIDVAYDFPDISEAADFISVMTYDYHGSWEKQVGHLSPLYGTPDEKHPFYNTNFTMNYIASLGAKRSKLLVGVPFYGQTYHLVRNDYYSIGDPVSGPGEPGEYTNQPGMLAYYEICDRVRRKNWKVEEGPIAHHKDQLVAYDDVKSIEKKGRWLIDNGFGGATAWTVDLDDFTNQCCLGAFALLRSLNYGLGLQTENPALFENCRKPPEPITPSPATMTTPNEALEGGNGSYQTSPMTTSTTMKTTTWPTWTERPSKKPATSASTSWTWMNPSQTTTTTARTTTINWNQPTTTETSCIGLSFLPNPADCGSYFRCKGGVLMRETCPSGLHWDRDFQQCNWPSKAKCQEGKPSTPVPTIAAQKPTITTTRKPPTPTLTSTPDTLSLGKDCEDGQYYAHPNSCTNYLFCVNGNLVTQQCGPGLNWNVKDQICDYAFKNPCKTRPASSAALVMKETDDKCIPGIFSSVPGDCESYYTCLWGRHEKLECPPGLHFSEDSHICDWPSRAKCQEKVVTGKPSIESEVTSNELPGTTHNPWVSHSTTQSPITTHKPWSQQTTTQKPWSQQTTTQKPWSQQTTTHKPWSQHPSTQKPWSQNPTTQKPWSQNPTTQQPITIWTPWTEKPKPLPPPLIDPSKVSPLSGHFKVVCYFTNWAWYRKGIGRYLPENIDHTLCTHIVYGFAVLDYSNLIIKAHDSWADFDNRFYDRVVAYKQRGLKVLLALGGWNDSAGDKYSRLVNSPSARAKFIEHALKFLEHYEFDGLDLDWEYPVCWQVDCNKGPKSDKQGFTALIRELSEKFRPRGLLLSSAVSPSRTVINEGYDVPALAKYLDWIAVMAYDYHGQWDKKTGHVAPLYYHINDDVYYFNANYTISYWISKGAPPRSLVMGMPMYGQSFTINDPKFGPGLNSPASAGTAGEFTRAAGFLAYYEICDRIKNHGWTVVQDPEGRIGPYAYKGNQWVSFDDPAMIRRKSQFIRDMGLGGGMIWALDLDDFKNRCGQGAHPLMRAIQEVLAEPPNDRDKPIAPPSLGQQLEWKVPSSPTKPSIDQIDHMKNRNDEYKVVCYFTNWAWYRQNGGRYVPEDIDPDLCTHVIYGFAVLDGTTLTIKTHDSWADIDNKFYERVVAYKSKGIKVLLAIGGWNDSAGDKYSRLVNSAASRSRFISHVLQFIEKYGFEGLDLDWEYPVCWQVECEKGPASDKKSFALFAKELSEAFRPKGLLLSTAVSPSKRVINAGYDVAEISKYFDWISVMTYDFHGQWDKKTGHVAPLYVHPQDWEPTFNANFSINYWLAQGAPPKKLVMGAPLYGQSFSLAERSQRGLNAPSYGGGEAGEATRARGFLAYYEICERTLKHGWTVVQDPERRMGPYAYKGDQWVSFDDAEQIRLKAEFIKKMGLAGGMVWALDLDDFKNICGCEPSPLLRTMNRVLRNYPDGPECRVTDGSFVPELPESTTRPPWQEITQSTTRKPITTTESTDTVEIEAGPSPPGTPLAGQCDERMFRPHKDDCTKYTVCNFGELVIQSCPNGLYWNMDRCDWPENTKCKSAIAVSQREESNEIPKTPKMSAIPDKPTGALSPIVKDTTSKIICYFTNWASYRSGKGKYTPENIDPNLCTHIVYSFAILDSNEFVIKVHDHGLDIANGYYKKITAYKKKGLKVLIAIGGGKDSEGDKYSLMVSNSTMRRKFIKSVIDFIEQHEFDGLDLDWEFPACPGNNCNVGSAADKYNFASLVEELSREFKPRNLLLSMAAAPSKYTIDAAYDVPKLAKYLDWITVLAYNYHGKWESKTGHLAPLSYYPGDENDILNTNFSIKYWMKKGAPAEKLVMGIPTYGNSFTLTNTENRGLQAPTTGGGNRGEFTREPGFLAFYEICDRVKSGEFSVTKDPAGRIGPYATDGNQWVGYDDASIIAKKGNLIRELGLAGGMIWALDFDDFTNSCGCGKYPLLSALNNALRGVSLKDCT